MRRPPLLVLGLLGVGVVLALGGILVALAASRPVPIDLELYAFDAARSPISVPVRVDGQYIGDTPLVLSDWWVADPRDSEAAAPAGAAWPPPAPEGTRLFTRSGLGAGSVVVDTAPWIEADGAFVVPIRVKDDAGETRRRVRIEVGPPGALLRPANSGGGTSQGFRSASVTVRFGFEQR